MTDYELRLQEYKKTQAATEVTLTTAAIILAENNDLGVEIHIAGLEVEICMNEKIIPALKAHIEEIVKFQKGEENLWE